MKAAFLLSIALCLVGCRASVRISPTPSSPPPPAAPFVQVKSHEEVAASGGSKLHIWRIEAEGIGELKVRMQVFRNGKRHILQERTVSWNRGSGKLSDGQIMMLEQSGDAFGAKGKVAPTLMLVFGDQPDGYV